jgi:DNA-binding IclR family transcriptional regulator
MPDGALFDEMGITVTDGGRLVVHGHTTYVRAWSAPVAGTDRQRFFAVLHAGPVKSARDAERASIVQTYREEAKDAP